MIVNLARLVIIALVVWLVVQALRRLLHPVAAPSKPAATGAAKNMVRCELCGLHLPESEAITAHGKHFCCQEHRHQYSDSV